MEKEIVDRVFPVPEFLRLAGHAVRWGLLGELARSDRQVHELTSLLGQQQSLVSYHLGKLRASGLVSMRRSSADGRDTYYSVDLARCGELLSAAGGALHPGLRLVPPEPAGGVGAGTTPARVLFLCTGNSARSQIAEAFAQHLGGAVVQACSAGSSPKPLHPAAVAVMGEYGIDIAGRSAKHLSVFADQNFDYVISLCDRVREVCPDFPGPPELIHWSIADPASPSGGPDTYALFQRTAAEVRTRVRFLLAAIERVPPAQEVH